MEKTVVITVLMLIFGKLCWESFLSWLNMQEARRRQKAPPLEILEVMDQKTYQKSVDYSLAKERLGLFNGVYEVLVLILILFSGVLPWLYSLFSGPGSEISILREAAFMIAALILISLPGVPLEYYNRFNLEERFGFNRSTVRLWVTDKFKGLVISLVLGMPVLCLIIFLVMNLGDLWWLWAFLALFIFQLIMMVLYPMIILPWFNKLTPLPQGELRQRLMNLADRTGFKARTIQVMDGSKRSGHSNAFFTGFGRFRRIVLFDTLIDQMKEDELEAVLAHEIGHYKKGHVPRMLAVSALMSLAGLWILAWLVSVPWFIQAFGFDHELSGPGPGLLLFGLLFGAVSFWLSPALAQLSRKHEYESDRFAARHVGPDPMVRALRKLSRENLSNLTPHPLYSGFYYSHPTLFERERAIAGQ
ncbi:M48 family metallopeptidase [Desulfonatronovibrio hydrogenovorans]|uniref:M48 family metallopeptidase n=1 Tax=Desulfonatronovibrio hydrogenovorans TaxID=53245 RepID=UPI001ABF5241|nr:M48 family metallopeptidase [Desulfonatronovibrio hydrogenovorans]